MCSSIRHSSEYRRQIPASPFPPHYCGCSSWAAFDAVSMRGRKQLIYIFQISGDTSILVKIRLRLVVAIDKLSDTLAQLFEDLVLLFFKAIHGTAHTDRKNSAMPPDRQQHTD